MPAIWRNVISTRSATCAAIFACAFISPLALADATGAGGPPVFMMSWDASNDTLLPFTYNPSDFGTTQYGTWQLGGGQNGLGGPPRERTGWRYQGSLSNTAWLLNWDCVANADPFVDSTINVTNLSNSTQTFIVFMPLNINPPIVPSSMMSGSVSAVVTDANFDGGAMLSATAANPIFQGSIDGFALANARLWNPGYNLLSPPFGTNNDSDSFTNNLGPSAITQIGITLRFNLSPGDSASVTGIFDVSAVPGPAVLPIFAVFGALAGRRRRVS